MANENPPARHSKSSVHALMLGVGCGALVIARFLLPRPVAPGAGDAVDTRSIHTTLMFATWAVAYYLAYTTPVIKSTRNTLLALGTTMLDAVANVSVGFVLLPVVWWNRRTARIETEILEDERVAAATTRTASDRPERKRKRGTDHTALLVEGAAASERPPNQGQDQKLGPEQRAALERLTAIARANNGEGDPDTLFPYLNRADLEVEAASERLVQSWDESPVVTLGYNVGFAVVLAARSELTDEHKRRARRNLAGRASRAKWMKSQMPSSRGKVDVYVRIGDDLTASDVVDAEFMREAFARCASRVVFLAIPTRESMVMASHPDPVAELAAARFEGAEHGEHPLSPCVFAFDGDGPLVPLTPQRG